MGLGTTFKHEGHTWKIIGKIPGGLFWVESQTTKAVVSMSKDEIEHELMVITT